jgi:hypothetical protein
MFASQPVLQAATTVVGINTFATLVIPADEFMVNFIYPATAAQIGGKPSGVGPAQFSDWVAMGVLTGVCKHQQNTTLDIVTGPPVYIIVFSGRPQVTGKVMLTSGGAAVHAVVYWLEKGSHNSPVYSEMNATHFIIRKQSDTSIIIITQPRALPSPKADYFVIYGANDDYGNTYYVFYGFRWYGTMASAYQLLEWVQKDTLSSQTQGYQIWKWTDTNQDGIVQPPNGPPGSDTYEYIDGA